MQAIPQQPHPFDWLAFLTGTGGGAVSGWFSWWMTNRRLERVEREAQTAILAGLQREQSAIQAHIQTLQEQVHTANLRYETLLKRYDELFQIVMKEKSHA